MSEPDENYEFSEPLPRFKPGDHIFDGFCHRGFDPSIDGWRNEVPTESEFPAVKQAKEILALFDALSEARVEIWRLKKDVAHYKRMAGITES